MKKISLIAVMFLTSCHNFDKDEEIGNIHSIFSKEVFIMKKKTIDSMKAVLAKAPKPKIDESSGWYSAEELKLPPGIIVGFNPETNGKEGPPFYVLMKGFDGRRSINKVNQEKWLLLKVGDIIK